MSIINSDFVFSVQEGQGHETNLATLVGVLQDAGFETQARPGLKLTTLVFARLSNSQYEELLRKDMLNCLQFGVTAQADSPYDRLRIIYSYLTEPKLSKGLEITPCSGKWQFVESIVPVSGYLAGDSVADWGKKAALSPSLSTSSFYSIYGPAVALYFEFSKFYIGALSILAIFGIVASIKSKQYSMTFAFMNLAWTVAFYIFWKRRERFLTNTWGVQNSHLAEEHDANIAKKQETSSSQVQNDKKGGFRLAKELAFVPIGLMFAGVLVSYQLACFVLEIFLSEIYAGPGAGLLVLTPTVLITAFMPVLNYVYGIVSDKFLDWENHDNESQRVDSFIFKSFLLTFLASYAPLLITSFIYLPFAHLIQSYLPVIQYSIASSMRSDRYMYKYLTKLKSQKEFTFNQGRLNAQFFFFIVTSQVIQSFMEYALPLLISHGKKLYAAKVLGEKEPELPEDAPEEKEWLQKVRHVMELPEQNISSSFQRLVVQFGYLSLFGPVWTLAPLISIVFNVLTFKLETLRLTSGKYFCPTIAYRADSIYPWDLGILALAWIGSIVSPLVTAFYRHGTKPPKTLGQFALDKASINVSSTTWLIFVLFISEHLFFALVYLGSKLSWSFKSKPEIKNSLADNDIELRKRYYSEKVQSKEITTTTPDWDSLPVEQVVKQAKVQERQVNAEKESQEANSKSNPDANRNEPKQNVKGVSGASTSVDTADKSTLTNRSARLSELEHKKKELEEKKKELASKYTLESHMNEGDSVINVPSDAGLSQQAIIDGDNHISMDDVKDIERKLSQNETKNIERKSSQKQTGVERKSSKKETVERKATSSSSKDRESGPPSAESSDSVASKDAKPSKKKSLKKIFKGK